MARALAVPAALLAVGLAGRSLAGEFQPPALYEQPLPTWGSAGAVQMQGGVTLLPGIPYKAETGYRPLALDLYLPPRGGPARPLVLWLHGGGFVMGNPRSDWTWGDWRLVLARLAARGYVVAGVSYRFSGEARFPAQLEDAQDALRFLRAHASLWNLRTDRAVAWGLSAGGMLAALMGTACADGQPAAGGDAAACVQGAVEWFGPTDLRPLATSGPLRQLLGCPEAGCADDALRAASAALQARAGNPPFLVMQGAADPLVPEAQARALTGALRAAGVPVELEVYPGLGHGFTGAGAAQLEQILMRTFRGIDELAGRPRP